MPKTKGKGEVKEGRLEREEGVREGASVMPPACSLENLSNLESCQDTARLCEALTLLLLACARVSEKKRNEEMRGHSESSSKRLSPASFKVK